MKNFLLICILANPSFIYSQYLESEKDKEFKECYILFLSGDFPKLAICYEGIYSELEKLEANEVNTYKINYAKYKKVEIECISKNNKDSLLNELTLLQNSLSQEGKHYELLRDRIDFCKSETY